MIKPFVEDTVVLFVKNVVYKRRGMCWFCNHWQKTKSKKRFNELCSDQMGFMLQ